MKKTFKPFNSEPPRPKAAMQLIDAFAEAYKPVPDEDLADDLFTIARIREYFNAWPIPKMPDPLPAYLDELEKRGYAMQTSYEGSPAIFCAYRRAKGMTTYAVEESGASEGADSEDGEDLRTGEAELRQLIAMRMAGRPKPEEPLPPFEEDVEYGDAEGEDAEEEDAEEENDRE